MISRQDFLRRMGVALSSLVLAGCRGRRTVLPDVTCYTVTPLSTATPLPSPPAELTRQAQALKATAAAGGLPADATRQAMATLARERLCACWSGLDVLAAQAADLEEGKGVREGLVSEHRAALDDLVAAGELDEGVAARVQLAFEEASYHVWRDNAPITCYEAVPSAYEPRTDLVQQAEALSEVSGGLDAAAVAQAGEALRQDMAFFAMLQSGQVQGSDLARLWAERGLKVSEADTAAAQFLIDLLLEE